MVPSTLTVDKKKRGFLPTRAADKTHQQIDDGARAMRAPVLLPPASKRTKATADRLLITRAEQGFCENQRAFADKIGVKSTTYNRWEVGAAKPNEDVLYLKLCRPFGYTIEWFRYGDERHMTMQLVEHLRDLHARIETLRPKRGRRKAVPPRIPAIP